MVEVKRRQRSSLVVVLTRVEIVQIDIGKLVHTKLERIVRVGVVTHHDSLIASKVCHRATEHQLARSHATHAPFPSPTVRLLRLAMQAQVTLKLI